MNYTCLNLSTCRLGNHRSRRADSWAYQLVQNSDVHNGHIRMLRAGRRKSDQGCVRTQQLVGLALRVAAEHQPLMGAQGGTSQVEEQGL